MGFASITIVGVGLIGGSIGKAIKARVPGCRVVGLGRSVGSLYKAVELGAIDKFETTMKDGVAGADLVIFCAPVDVISKQVLEAATHCKPGCLLTDAGSTKTKLIEEIGAGNLPDGVQFIGSHPIAGSAKRGAEAGSADLFVNRLTVVTPTKHSSEAGVLAVEAFWQSLGSKVTRLSAEEHDRLLAWSSHLPHITASILATILPEDARPYVGTGFRDTTRIAAGEPEVWLPIIRHNEDDILACLNELELNIRSFRTLLGQGKYEMVGQLLEQGKRGRDALGS